MVIEDKFVGPYNKTGASRLDNTADGLQGSQTWVAGGNRIEKAVGDRAIAADIADSVKSGRTETWVVSTRADGSTEVHQPIGINGFLIA